MGCQIGGLNIDDDQELLDGFKEVANLKVPVAVHAEDKVTLMANEEKLKGSTKIGVATFCGLTQKTSS